MALRDVTREAILAAIGEYDRLGQDRFLAQYGFDRARSYLLIHDGKAYDSKAIVGVAHGFLPGKQPLASNEFSGGEATVGRLLRRLGFTLETGQAAAWGAGTLAKLANLRQNSSGGSPAPHKPLLFLLALGRLQQNGSSELPWSVAAEELADLITRFTPPARTSPTQRAAYPYTRLRADGVWLLDRDVSMDSVGELNAAPVTGRIEPSLEAALREDAALTREVARRLVTDNFEEEATAREVLQAVGLDPDEILLDADPEPSVPAASHPVPGEQATPITAGRDVYSAGRDLNIYLRRDDLHLEHLAVFERSVPLDDSDLRTVDGYVLRRKLGLGAMGIVYLAQDVDGQPVALKLLRPEFAADEHFLQRFGQEAKLASKVDATHTAKVLKVGTDSKPPYLVTEFIDGPTLDWQVTKHGPLSPERAKGVAIGTATALIAIHNAGIVHRDLKPSNVILSHFNPRVIDFGIARSLNAATRLTQVGKPVGSPAYMSPEQVLDEDVTQASDIFSWAGLMVYISTGKQPFGGPDTNMFALPYLVRETEPDLSAVPANLRDLVAAALRKDPGSRPTAPEILSTLTGN